MNHSELVYDGKTFQIPELVGKPAPHQFKGSDLDNLSELSGRICYYSVSSPKSRSSEEYHKHIVEVGHLSVYEHANLTFEVKLSRYEHTQVCMGLLNRPGIYLRSKNDGTIFVNARITANVRAVREWFNYADISEEDHPQRREIMRKLGLALQYEFKQKAPLTFSDFDPKPEVITAKVVEPESDDEIWLTFYQHDVSRGYTHELVRHGDWTAFSQRSTRYVDESESDWSWHPLFRLYYEHAKDPMANEILKDCEQQCKFAYDHYRDALQQFLINKGVDKFTARKQARGAARGVLGNALATEIIFSANLAQLKRVILLRANEASDGEIRLVFAEMFEFLSSKYPDRFVNWHSRECPDGIGRHVWKD